MISLCVTSYNRTELLFECIEGVLNDDRVSEVIICDDCSAIEIYNTIVWKYNGVEKVKIFRNETNLDCYKNKRQAMKKASNEWCILFDSDNKISTEFLDVLFSQKPWNNQWAYAPEFARPHFDFTELSGQAISRNNIASLLGTGNCGTLLNAMNYFVNRDEYLRIWDRSIDPVTSDSLYQNLNWLKAGNSVYVTPGLQYYHRVNDHRGEEVSHFSKHFHRTPQGLTEELLNQLKRL